jgi:hypothetical protein
VLIAFVAAASLTLLLSAFALIIDALGDYGDGSIFGDVSGRRFWREMIEKVVLVLSDQQLVTGTAILAVGIYRLPPSHGQISFYHFTILADLAWFSSNTHQLAVMVLREYFQNNDALRIWRIIGMLTMGLLLLVVTGFTSVVPQSENYSCPAQCVILDFDFSGGLRGRPLALMLISVIFLIWGYSVALSPFFSVTRNFWDVEQWSNTQRRPCETFRRVAKPVIRVIGSEGFKIIFSTLFFALGIYELFSDRAYGEQQLAEDQSEDQWSFGQILPLALLALPLLTALEVYYGVCQCTFSGLTLSCRRSNSKRHSKRQDYPGPF